MALAAALTVWLLWGPAPAAAQSPPEPDTAEGVTIAEVYEDALAAVPDQDLSWIALRSVVGPELWDSAARLLPDTLLEATLPAVGADRLSLDDVPTLDLDPVPESDSAQPTLSVGGVLGAITRLITIAGNSLLGAFLVLHVINAVGAYRTGGTFSLAGWGSLRLTGSFGLLMPIGDQGWCVAQAAVVLSAQMGIGLANSAWDLAAEPLLAQARTEAAAEAAAREILAIDAEEAAAAAVATGLCVALTSRSWNLGQSAGAWREDARLHSRRCGGIEDPGAYADRLAGLARAYGPAGERVQAEIARVHGERVAVLSALRERVTAAALDPRGWFFAASTQAEPLLEWSQAEPPPPLRLDAVEPRRGLLDPVKGYRTPAATQSAWWLLAELMGERAAGACLREWAGTDSEGEPVWRQLHTAIRWDGLGTVPEVDPLPRSRWPFQEFKAGLAGERDAQCAADDDSPYWQTVEALREGNEEAAAEALAPLMQDLYGAQLAPLIGDASVGQTGAGRRGWLLAGAVYWHLLNARGVNRTLRELATPEVVPPDTDPAGCAEGSVDCRGLHAWHAGRMVARAAAHSARAGAPALAYEGRLNTSEQPAVEQDAGPLLARWMVRELRAAGGDNAPLTRMMGTGQDLVGLGFVAAVPGKALSMVPGPWGKIGDKLLVVGLILLVAGLALAVWLPCLPLIAWLASVWAWVVSVVLGLMAAPLWALAHAVPDGHGPLSGYSRNGYQLLLFTAARPVFLIAGLLLAMLLSGLICKIAAVAFSAALGGYSAAALVEGATPALHWVLVTAAAVILFAFVVWLVTKTFTLCHELPDRVFEWVGGSKSLGDEDMLDRGRAFVGGLAVWSRQVAPAPKPARLAAAAGEKAAKAPAKETKAPRRRRRRNRPASSGSFPGVK